MPYITEKRKDELSQLSIKAAGLACQNAGEINYCISTIIANYIIGKGKRYEFMDDCTGALTGAMVEFNRRVVAPYEDQKIKENGDIDYQFIE